MWSNLICPFEIFHHYFKPSYSFSFTTGMKKFLFLARKSDIRVMSLDADKNVDVILPIKDIGRASGVDFDILKKKIYWTDTETESVNCAYLDGTGLY